MSTTIEKPDAVAQREAQMQQAEEVLDSLPQKHGVAKGLFDGRFVADWVFPYPQLAPKQREEVESVVAELERFCDAKLDAARIDRDADIPRDVIEGLAELGLLGMTAPVAVGGRAFSQLGYCKLLEVIGSRCASTAIFVNAHHSIGMRALMLFGTDEQKRKWLPGIADGTGTMAFAITEPDAGTNSHNITTTARRDGDEWLLTGRKIYISGIDEADNVLVVARTEDAKTGKLKPCLFVVPTDAEGLEAKPIPMEIVSPELQFGVFIDDVRLPSDALVGDEDAGLVQLFAGLNPERIMAASFSTGLARFALGKAAAYAKERTVFQGPIGGHQAIAHPLAMSHIEIEMARLMTQKAAALYDAGDDMGAGEAANMAKYAAAEAACDAADRAVQTHGGNGITQEYGMAGLLVATRAGRIAPVSREMILNFVAMHSLGLPKSY